MAQMAVGNADDALDILQEAMLKLAQKYADRPPEEWAPLFQTILQSRIRDHYRRSAIRNRFRHWFGGGSPDETNSDPLQELADEYGPRPEQETATTQSMTLLDAAVQALPLRQQQAFMLRALEGLDVAATALAMGCSAGSVKTHYSRAVHTLREHLEDAYEAK